MRPIRNGRFKKQADRIESITYGKTMKMKILKPIVLITISIIALLTAISVTKYQNRLKPELSIIYLSFSPYKPFEGDIETIKFEVENTGKITAKNFEVCLKDNGTLVNKEVIDFLAPNKKVPVVFNYEFTSPGNHLLSVEIDCKNAIKESNKRNNCVKMKFNVEESIDKFLVYKVKLGNEWFTTNYGGASPVISGNRIYIGGKNRYFLCINKTTGKLIWKFTVKNAGSYPGIYTTPVLHKGNVYFGATGTDPVRSSGYLFSLNADTGKEQWEFKTEADISSIALHNNKLFALDRDGVLYCLDATKGSLIKKYKTNNVNDILCSSIKAASNILYLKTENSNFTNLMAIDKSLKKVIWSVKIKRDSSAIPVPDSFILLNNLIYLNGKYCIDAISGKMIWINKNIGSGVEVLDRHLFTLSKDGELFKLDLTNGSIIWKETIEPSVAPIYAKDNTLMIGTERGNIYLIDERYGEIITSFKTNSILTIPIVSDEKNIYAISEDGYLYCFKRK